MGECGQVCWEVRRWRRIFRYGAGSGAEEHVLQLKEPTIYHGLRE